VLTILPSTINIISLLDCAFSFYQNFPCRLTPAELECDLPCEDLVFNSVHPFTHANFHFTRETTVYEAFQYLFDEDQPIDKQKETQAPTGGMDLTVLDTFILIHRTWALPLACRRKLMITLQFCMHI
jgi:hypothetical protein